MDLESLLISIYVIVDDWWQEKHSEPLRKPGRPAVFSDSEVLTLTILSQWPRFRSERLFPVRRYLPPEVFPKPPLSQPVQPPDSGA
jgi:hypothetical protein